MQSILHNFYEALIISIVHNHLSNLASTQFIYCWSCLRQGLRASFPPCLAGFGQALAMWLVQGQTAPWQESQAWHKNTMAMVNILMVLNGSTWYHFSGWKLKNVGSSRTKQWVFSGIIFIIQAKFRAHPCQESVAAVAPLCADGRNPSSLPQRVLHEQQVVLPDQLPMHIQPRCCTSIRWDVS